MLRNRTGWEWKELANLGLCLPRPGELILNERVIPDLERRLESEGWMFLGNEPMVEEYEVVTVPVERPTTSRITVNPKNNPTIYEQVHRRRLKPHINTVEELAARYSMGGTREVRVEKEAFDSTGNPLRTHMAVYVRKKLPEEGYER